MVDYNNFSKTFANSRKNMKWAEIEYFLEGLEDIKEKNILDIGCGSGRLLQVLKDNGVVENKYMGLDLSVGLLEEARKTHEGYIFEEMNMLDISKIEEKYDIIFFIASFHHLQNFEERMKVIDSAYKILNKGGKIYFTNWALNSDLNKLKYNKSMIQGSENEFGSLDYNIKIGEYLRYYHCFSIEELENLFSNSGFEIIENRLFDNQRNIISIIKKTED